MLGVFAVALACYVILVVLQLFAAGFNGVQSFREATWWAARWPMMFWCDQDYGDELYLLVRDGSGRTLRFKRLLERRPEARALSRLRWCSLDDTKEPG